MSPKASSQPSQPNNESPCRSVSPLRLFEEQNPSHKWKDVERDIFKMLRSVFEAAESRPPPAGIARDGQSRAMYAVDLMLEWADEGRTEMRPQGPNSIERISARLLA